MDAAVLRAMLRWPDIPDVYGWLRLDRRGNWRMRNPHTVPPAHEPIGNATLRDFIGRNYARDPRGCWYFQNGPQRVFVGLAYAPFVFRLEGGTLVDQCGTVAGAVTGAWLDEEGSLVLQCENGRLGLLDDRELGAVADGLLAGEWRAGGRAAPVPLGRLASSALERRFGFVREPSPPL